MTNLTRWESGSQGRRALHAMLPPTENLSSNCTRDYVLCKLLCQAPDFYSSLLLHNKTLKPQIHAILEFHFKLEQKGVVCMIYFAGYSEGYSSAGSYLHEQLSAKENKVIQLNGEVAELRRKVFDLEETLAEKEQVRRLQHQVSWNFSSRFSLHEQLQLVWPLPVLQPKVETP